MEAREIKKINDCAGCGEKLSPATLRQAFAKNPQVVSDRLLDDFDTMGNVAVAKLQSDLMLIHTANVFPPIVSDPYLYGKIAAAAALSPIYAMGGELLSALNIACFPEREDPNILAEILRGSAEKVRESGGILCVGHTTNDKVLQYGLSAAGTIHSTQMWKRNTCKIGDKIILTKPLGVGMIVAAYKLGEVSEASHRQATDSMERLNKYAAEKARHFRISAATNVSATGFLGSLKEMAASEYTIRVAAKEVPYISEARRLAEAFLVTAESLRNRKLLADEIDMQGLDLATEEILFDPQTSGGLLVAVHPEDAQVLLAALAELRQPIAVVGEVTAREQYGVVVCE